MFARESLDTSLGDLGTMLKDRTDDVDEVRVAPGKIKFHLSAADPAIKVDRKTYPATDHALEQVAALVQMPVAFLKRSRERVDGEVFDNFLDSLLVNTVTKDTSVKIRKGGFIESVDEWGKVSIEPLQVTRAVTNVLGEDSHIERLIDTPAFFGFDVRVPESRKTGTYQDGEALDVRGRKIGDVTSGGVRVGLNLKQGLAPTVEEYLYRLACTNGMTIEDSALKVDARGQTVDEVIAEIEHLAEIAFSRAEQSMKHFYALKNQPVDNVERSLRAIARERGIPDRSMVALMDLAAGEDMPDNPSMFDVVNLVTNFANSPSITRDGGRLILEGAGGSVVADNAARCGHCQQKVVH